MTTSALLLKKTAYWLGHVEAVLENVNKPPHLFRTWNSLNWNQ